jgi:hypothetical protein
MTRLLSCVSFLGHASSVPGAEARTATSFLNSAQRWWVRSNLCQGMDVDKVDSRSVFSEGRLRG